MSTILLSKSDIETLIQIGKCSFSNKDISSSLLLSLRDKSYINLQPPRYMEVVYLSLQNDDDIKCLIRGLEIAHKEYEWDNYSVSTRALVYVNLEHIGKLHLLPRRKEIFKRFKIRQEQQLRNEKHQSELQRQAMINRFEKKKITFQNQHECMLRQRVNSKKRNEHIKHLLTLEINERWEQFLLDTSHRFDYYPDEWTDVTVQELKSISPEVLNLILIRLSCGKRRDPWRGFYRKVLSAHEETSK
jgi:hypothetical protein